MINRKPSSTATILFRLVTVGVGTSASLGGGLLGYLTNATLHIDEPAKMTKAKSFAFIAGGAAICTAAALTPVFALRSIWRAWQASAPAASQNSITAFRNSRKP